MEAIWASEADKRAITWSVGFYAGYLPPSRHRNRVTQVRTEGTSGETAWEEIKAGEDRKGGDEACEGGGGRGDGVNKGQREGVNRGQCAPLHGLIKVTEGDRALHMCPRVDVEATCVSVHIACAGKHGLVNLSYSPGFCLSLMSDWGKKKHTDNADCFHNTHT